ncbi:helix-turn-helix domain-containing protein [Agrobacterium tumefaciens]|nr:helix-turn-helix transcriptional regulator [Agrobacterium tumefaciens]
MDRLFREVATLSLGPNELDDLRRGVLQHRPTVTKTPNQLGVSDGALAEIRFTHACVSDERIDFGKENGALIRFHAPKISSIEDVSTIPNEGRAKISEIEDIRVMGIADWRARLQDALEASGKSAREVSLAAGKGPGYVHSILKEGKEPTVDNLIAICGVLNVSLSQVIYGIEMSAETAEILSLLENSPNARDGILKILRDKTRA